MGLEGGQKRWGQRDCWSELVCACDAQCVLTSVRPWAGPTGRSDAGRRAPVGVDWGGRDWVCLALESRVGTRKPRRNRGRRLRAPKDHATSIR